MKNLLLSLFIIGITLVGYGQTVNEIKRALKADKVEFDGGNGDGVFKARNKLTKKWGMYQWMYSGTESKELIPMRYDDILFFPFNGSFTIIYNNHKLGVYLCEWSYGDNAKQTVKCIYDDYKKFTNNGRIYLAVSKNKKWGWVDWKTGVEKSNFTAQSADDLLLSEYND